ncbi:MAG: bifunctional diaminohydroxyphosphoribosylaminopyrimidine deaminase/5-amino-6-(5-phosphoribosylamino)uracil reductase RibD [Verrucomicrobiales bacterium]
MAERNSGNEDQRWMLHALSLAERGRGLASPNPCVGAVIVHRGRCVGVGYHCGPGTPHAEVHALRRAGVRAKNATLYVTLEPCSTHGRTGPCTEAILQAGLRRVVVGTTDPNPRHQGQGCLILEQAGLELTRDVEESRCREMIAGFSTWITKGRPRVTLKAALSLDGRITRLPGEPKRMSSPSSWKKVLETRAHADAILVGGETVRTDNPRLHVPCRSRGSQPWRVVMTRSGSLPIHSHVFAEPERSLIYRDKSWPEVLQDLGQRGVTELLVEGGGQIHGGLRDAKLVDRVIFQLTPWLTCGDTPAVAGEGAQTNAEGLRLISPTYEQVGPDLWGEAMYSAE